MIAELNQFARTYPWLTGFFVSAGVGHVVVFLVNNLMWANLESGAHSNTKKPTRGYMTWLLGVVERILYTLALIFGGSATAFIGLWLTLKFAGDWRKFGDSNSDGHGRINIFLVGNGLSLLFAVLGALVIKPDLFQSALSLK